MHNFDFDQLFILDIANNHQGDVEHGLRIIRETAEVVREKGLRAAIKLQFRELDTFIHPDFRDAQDPKHIQRFLGTRLSWEDFHRLVKEVHKQGMVTMATPFDETSIEYIKEMDVDVIKLASCSCGDRPLIDAVSRAGKPVVASTAGASTNQIDHLVCVLENQGVNFALMHCVALYPTPDKSLNLNQIDFLKNRFPGIPVGFSTHEDPDADWQIQIAYGKGAQLFERHIGVQTEQYQLNAYSSTPEQIGKWMDSYKKSHSACGGTMRGPARPEETASLISLMRGAYATGPIKKGEVIRRDQVFFAMPFQKDCMAANDWREGLVADRDYAENDALSRDCKSFEPNREEIIAQTLLQVKGMLSNAGIWIGKNSSIEISHHYGLDRFREFGAVIVDCVNRAYCKKLIVQLPRQKNPYHYHAIKEETFQLLSGDLQVEIEGVRYSLKPGDTLLVEVGAWHKFHTLDGAIFEEISTTHINDDSFYEDERVARMPRHERKTKLPNWEAALA
jgi:sialic acid synthase SpsE/mannose-6-phosphate isomerase-like protein (cupin superfamily)